MIDPELSQPLTSSIENRKRQLDVFVGNDFKQSIKKIVVSAHQKISFRCSEIWYSQRVLMNLQMWTLGYDLNNLISIFEALPSSLVCPLYRALESAHALDSQRLKLLHSENSSRLHEEVDDYTHASDPLLDPTAIWEEEEAVGFLTASYDGVSGKRRSVGMNPRQAALIGADREDALRSLDWCMQALEVPEMDLLACVVHELGQGARTQAEIYVRGIVGRGTDRHTALLHCVKTRQYDSCGRITRVSMSRTLQNNQPPNNHFIYTNLRLRAAVISRYFGRNSVPLPSWISPRRGVSVPCGPC
jgi:hypothetical protein